MIMKRMQKKQIHILLITSVMILLIILLFPVGNKLLATMLDQAFPSTHIYSYSLPHHLKVEDTSTLQKPQAVPILMYHGVIVERENLGPNTSRKAFIAQMEMLKEKGYQTISVKEYDLFRQGIFELPPKPIIITFDDGRNDSYYTVDNILEKLGFKATIFVATIRANTNDPFYLTWEQLKILQSSGRWEIEAHGRRSHEAVTIDQDGTVGRYYTSRIFTEGKGLESVQEYKKRVEQDYRDGVADIKEHLGLDASYFAVPLSNYGIFENANYPDAYIFNEELTKRFFKLAFIETGSFESYYNYRDSKPYRLIRLEVKNMDAEALAQSLDHFAAKPTELTFPSTDGMQSFLKNTQLLYGNLETNKDAIILSSSTSAPSARILFGDRGWKNYRIQANIIREKGRSVSMLIYYRDEDNCISLTLGEKTLFLVERVDGKNRELASYYPFEKEGVLGISLAVKDKQVSATVDRISLAEKIPIKLARGAVGLSVWDPKSARSSMTKLEVASLYK